MDGEYLEIPGSDRCMMYHLRYVGGPVDGVVANSFKPFDTMQEPDGALYAADGEGEATLEWVDDWTRQITLKFRGYMSIDEYRGTAPQESKP